MLKNQYLKQWSLVVSPKMPHLSLPQAIGLATWSFGVAITQSSSLTRISEFIAQVNGEKTNTVRQRLKEWYQEADAKKGQHRRHLDVSRCFAPLLLWVMSLLPSNLERLAFALDATSISNRFTILSLNILLAGCGIPVAWSIVRATEPGSWKPHWQKLLAQMRDVIPSHFQVIVTADRGLYADWLYHLIENVGWHPFLRINHQGCYRVPPQPTWKPLAGLVGHLGQFWSSPVICFKTHPLACTLLVCWDEDYKEPWLVLTDLNPREADVLWYGLRSSTECVYRDLKSDGWKWHHTRLLDPQRAERLWLVLAVATLWMVMLGGHAEERSPSATLELLPPTHVTFSKPLGHTTPRRLSCFLLGALTLLANLLNHLPIHLPGWLHFPRTPCDTFFAYNSS
jgi:Transposase DDE domain